jgi:hypothetical protein
MLTPLLRAGAVALGQLKQRAIRRALSRSVKAKPECAERPVGIVVPVLVSGRRLTVPHVNRGPGGLDVVAWDFKALSIGTGYRECRVIAKSFITHLLVISGASATLAAAPGIAGLRGELLGLSCAPVGGPNTPTGPPRSSHNVVSIHLRTCRAFVGKILPRKGSPRIDVDDQT